MMGELETKGWQAVICVKTKMESCAGQTARRPTVPLLPIPNPIDTNGNPIIAQVKSFS